MKCCLAFALLLLSASSVFSADDPGTQYVDAFVLTQEGDAAKAKSDWKTAYDKFSTAQSILLAIKETSPSWNVHLVRFRLDHCTEQLAAIKPHLPSAPTVTPQRPTTVTSGSELDKLRTELAQARAEIERTKASQLTVQARLTQKDADEATRMAEVNQKIADLQKQLADHNRKVDEINTLRANLATANKAAAQLDELRKANADLQTQLADAKRNATAAADLQKLRAELSETRATTDRAIQQQATQLAQLKEDNQALTAQLADAKRANAASSNIATELLTLREELASARAINAGNASQIEVLQQERESLLARIAAINSSPAASPGTAPPPASSNELQRQNRDLNERLASATRQLNKMRRQIADDAATDVALTRKLSAQLSTLQNQNREFARQLPATQRSDTTRSHVTPTDSARSDTTRSDVAPTDVTHSDANRGVLKARRQAVTSPSLPDTKPVVVVGQWNAQAKQKARILCESEPRIIDVINLGERPKPEDGQKVRVTATLHSINTPVQADKDRATIQTPATGYFIDWTEARWERVQDK